MIGEKLVLWYVKNKRDLPWRKTKDPYPIWVSEIMLQQTQVKKVIPYYLRFIASFPTLKKLAKTNEDEVLKLWSGLGYYRRARNLHKGAQLVLKDFSGKVPAEWNEIRKIPGIGDYTASDSTCCKNSWYRRLYSKCYLKHCLWKVLPGC